MDAVEYLKTLRRLCESKERCSGCVLYNKEDSCCIADIGGSAEDTVQIVEQWAKDHPLKTRQSEFLKMFPNADLFRDVIKILPCSVEKGMSKCCSDKRCEECRKDYWLTEVTDNGNVY